MKRNRVVITGMGILAPNGIGNDKFWESLLAGRSGIGPITLFDASDLKSRIAGEVKNFDPHDYIEPELKPKRMARHTQFAYAAAMMALKDAGLEVSEADLPSPTPVVVGVSTSAMDIIERSISNFAERGENGISPTAVGALTPQAAANVIADRIGVHAHASTVSSACPSGLDALAIAATMIESGAAELAIAGGADAPITKHTFAAFIATGMSSCRNGEPERASRPFDLERDSGVISEGAGMFVLEDLERAEARGARPYLEINGYARQRDDIPENPGSGLLGSMRLALANSSRSIDAIDYICAYGPGHPVLDAAEVRYIKEVFGERAYSMPISSIKGVTGNPLAAGGPLQVAACALSLRDQIIPPTANYELPDPDCDLDFVPRARKAKLDSILLNVRGLGGSASSLVVSRSHKR
ncbi:MAG: beta-ketoacyl-[acyl-carrier-protein] synthase II [Verrucomicrobia bacterium]|nr:MAG: beta-ketoacyl-[acyl-carrier-protein] synthase II [Verrucomicrobiota bacterium]PYL95134.1 MAG: beta-ketoacyl-[acyl-carrier-protein] synthase II [Verrucomicrobiota bacterium]HTD01026.1 beta-ketoacyl-[acyl-carrier-protein] synthase family protein [Chthoniobacterales bacterium]